MNKLELNHIYSAYNVALPRKYYYVNQEYLCDYCDQKFLTDWQIRIPNASIFSYRGREVICPFCGKVHSQHIYQAKRNEWMPYQMTLKLYSYKQKTVLIIDCKCFTFKDEFFSTSTKIMREKFTFDIENNCTLYQKVVWDNWNTYSCNKKIVSCELSSKTAYAVLEDSNLKYLKYGSLAYIEKQLREFQKYLRKSIEKNMFSRYGKLESIYINPYGLEEGVFLKSIVNYALRIKSPYRENIERLKVFKKECELQWLDFNKEMSFDRYLKYYHNIQSGKDEISSLIFTYNLPNKKQIRKLISFENARIVKMLYNIIENYDNFLEICDNTLKIIGKCTEKKYFAFLKYIKNVYGENKLKRFIKNHEKLQFMDCVYMFEGLDKKQLDLLTNKIRIRDLHNWLVKRVNSGDRYNRISSNIPNSDFINEDFKVPEEIKNRFNMQLDSLKFFLPQKTLDLLEGGKTLVNCVGGYGYRRKMMNNTSHIVFVTNDIGKLIACLEIEDSKILQAKLAYNVEVNTNNVINDEIIKWAEKAGLQIATNDICIEKTTESKILTITA